MTLVVSLKFIQEYFPTRRS